MPKGSIEIRNTTRDRLPRVPFARIARHILGSSYTLSLVICADRLSRSINTQYRKKTYAPNVLSFPLERNEGEIFLNIRKAAREAKAYKVPVNVRIALLFVHGCYHLKGLTHGSKMETLERTALKRFGF